MIEKNKNYTAKELQELLGIDWRERLGIQSIPSNIYHKPIINDFSEFDEETKNIYIKIYNILKEKNPNQDINVWATGSRVKGTWRTISETDEMKVIYGEKRIKYSDYDIVTDAKNLPTADFFFKQLNVKVDYSGGDYKILIK